MKNADKFSVREGSLKMGIRPHTSYISRKNNVLYKANKKTQYLAARLKAAKSKSYLRIIATGTLFLRYFVALLL